MSDIQPKESLWLPCPKCGASSKIKVYEDTVLPISLYTVPGARKKPSSA